ncbi:acyltransferase domain-containing protein [Burkholderia cepacia]|uniref:acyltransferase domain-containing protein n=1 Tax=Burkholderia cepacia TaxID=292 RepID=UPI0011AFE2E7|nr:acyltransferase domain-containing protein [Burkholderia cepacia]KAB1588220.1 acyltransferase domain-containing protein [Burkholderia cepacia]
MKTIFMYSGQGSQYYHMGAQLYTSDRTFRQQLDSFDDQLRTQWGHSVLALMYAPQSKKTKAFDDVVLSSLAIFMVEQSLTETLVQYGCRPDGILSVSMGALAATCASGAVSHHAMLEATLKMAEGVRRSCVAGAMLAILAPPALYDNNHALRQSSVIAAVNTPIHFVISLPRSKVATVEDFLSEKKVAFQRMPVSHAYHSCWIDPARDDFFSVFARVRHTQSLIPMNLCSIPALQHSSPTQALWNAIRLPMRLRETIRHFEQSGPCHYIDLGPSGTLATLLKYILPPQSRSRVHAILTPLGEDDRNLHATLAADMMYSEASSKSP